MLSRTQRFDDWLDHLSDRVNPILVRELRQTLKSRFVISTFGVFLLATWGFSVARVVQYQEYLEYFDLGGVLFFVHAMALGISLMLPVPIHVFFSIQREFSENTYETLVVTTMTPQRIVFGKLQTAGVEALLYCSAIAPFVCFTYLLGGIGLAEIVGTLLLIGALSFAMSLWGLLLGSISVNSFWQAVNLGLLLMSAWGAVSLCFSLLTSLFIERISWLGLLSSAVCASVLLVFLFAIAFSVATARLNPLPDLIMGPNGKPQTLKGDYRRYQKQTESAKPESQDCPRSEELVQ